MLERLQFVLNGCVGESALDGDSVESSDKDQQTLKQEGALIFLYYIKQCPGAAYPRRDGQAELT